MSERKRPGRNSKPDIFEIIQDNPLKTAAAAAVGVVVVGGIVYVMGGNGETIGEARELDIKERIDNALDELSGKKFVNFGEVSEAGSSFDAFDFLVNLF